MKNLEKPVIVIWEDAWQNSNLAWSLEDLNNENPMMITSIGMLIENNKRGVTIAVEKHGDKYKFVHHIPRGMVRCVKILKS